MKYYVIEGIPNGKYNASTKARNDAEHIMTNENFEKLYVNTEFGVQKNKLLKWKQILLYFSNYFVWNKKLKQLNNGDIVIIQYPILNTTLFFDKLIKKYKKRGVYFIALIHDLDSLRFKPDTQGKYLYNRIKKEDKKVLNSMNYIISHNDSMKKELLKMGNKEENVKTLKIFDYILFKEPKKIKRSKKDPIIIAGNLSSEKAKYLLYLKEIKSLKFNLFGVGFNKQIDGKNIFYKGKFLPEELLDHLEGSFGLVWDGVSINECTGGFGDYLKYNNPHKASLYLTAGIPLIVWDKSALADFVINNKLGIAVDSLNNINESLKKITDEEYNEMLTNISKISNKTKNGKYLKTVICEILKSIDAR